MSNIPTTCFDLVRRERIITDEMLEAGWYADSESDLYEIVECGANVTEIVDGYECADGHHHFFYGSRSQRLEDMANPFD